jgi:hypothetical protein
MKPLRYCRFRETFIHVPGNFLNNLPMEWGEALKFRCGHDLAGMLGKRVLKFIFLRNMDFPKLGIVGAP